MDPAPAAALRLQHLAAVGRTAPELQAESRHQHLPSLGAYVRLSEETSARIAAEADSAAALLINRAGAELNFAPGALILNDTPHRQL
ncbi:hypothetical protein [Nonomuraea sp. NEAU-A123]|uniref:hypothetical protein n=1 Tax=Nonomuraea sp. NEAU-A123 TaxID=2839649 RepID=UPI001BE41BED|nr:hypothetical protein [Nonomuraea sp. NEAU-A123]MBT2234280.1 hypothetical protein [Nonomuraea sp. NEAU-A123]